MLKVTPKVFVFIIINTLTVLIACLYWNSAINNLYDSCIIALVFSIVALIEIATCSKEIGVIGIVFTIIYICCHFGRVVLIQIFSYESNYYLYNSFKFFEQNEMPTAIMLACISLPIMLIGLLISSNKHMYRDRFSEVPHVDDYLIEEKKDAAMRVMSNIVFFISIIPAILNYIEDFMFKYVGISIFSTHLASLIGIIGNMIAIPIIYYVYKGKSRTIDVLSLMYYVTWLFLGGRGKPICMIVTLLILITKRKSNSYFKTGKLKIAVGSYIVSSAFIALAHVRGKGLEFLTTNFMPSFWECLTTKNPLAELSYELGVAIAPLSAMIAQVPSHISFQYGRTFFLSLLGMIPGIGMILPESITKYMEVSVLISNVYSEAWGASILQDFYINLGFFAPILMLFVGIIVANLSYTAENINRYSIAKVVFSMAFVFPVLWWPRSTLGYITRYFGTVVVLPWLIYKVIYGRTGKS